MGYNSGFKGLRSSECLAVSPPIRLCYMHSDQHAVTRDESLADRFWLTPIRMTSRRTSVARHLEGFFGLFHVISQSLFQLSHPGSFIF